MSVNHGWLNHTTNATTNNPPKVLNVLNSAGCCIAILISPHFLSRCMFFTFESKCLHCFKVWIWFWKPFRDIYMIFRILNISTLERLKAFFFRTFKGNPLFFLGVLFKNGNSFMKNILWVIKSTHLICILLLFKALVLRHTFWLELSLGTHSLLLRMGFMWNASALTWELKTAYRSIPFIYRLRKVHVREMHFCLDLIEFRGGAEWHLSSLEKDPCTDMENSDIYL